MAFFLRLVLWASLAFLTASELLYDVQPNVISEELTPKLVINCSISNNQVQQIDNIKSLSLARYNEHIKEFESLFVLEAATLNLTQLVQFQRSKISFGNLYITLTLQAPTQSDARVYRCNVNGDNDNMKNISLVNKKEVKYETVSTTLLEEIRRLKKIDNKDRCSCEKGESIDNKSRRSKLYFVGSSEVVNEFVEPLTLTCSVKVSNKSPDQNDIVQFMYIIHETNGVIEAKNINTSQPFVTTNAEVDSKNVSGEHSDNELRGSTIQASWSSMKVSESGKYYCGAHIIDSEGKAERLNEMLTITVKRPTFEDLMNVIHELLTQANEDRKSLQSNEEHVKSIRKDLTNQQQNIKEIELDLDTKRRDFTRNQQEIDTQKQNVITINKKLNIEEQHTINIYKALDDKNQNFIRIKQDLDTQSQDIIRMNKDLEAKQQNISSLQQDCESTRNDFTLFQQNMSIFKENLETKLFNLSTALTQVKQQVDKGLSNNRNNTVSYLPPTSCRDVSSSEDRVILTLTSGLKVMCDTKTDGGGWIIIQRRINGKVDFYRDWKEYRDGFGDYNIGEFYMGNENIYKLTSTGQYDLRIDLEYNNTKYFAQYKDFKVLSETEKYKLQIKDFTGNVSDNLSRHNNMFFTTLDRDNDKRDSYNCAVDKGAWLYDNCHDSNLNGEWQSKIGYRGLNWKGLTGFYRSVSFTEMKIREYK